jgi:hypothetical protein
MYMHVVGIPELFVRFESDPAKTRRKSFSAREIIIIIRRRKEITYNNNSELLLLLPLTSLFAARQMKSHSCALVQYNFVWWSNDAGATRWCKNKRARALYEVKRLNLHGDQISLAYYFHVATTTGKVRHSSWQTVSKGYTGGIERGD